MVANPRKSTPFTGSPPHTHTYSSHPNRKSWKSFVTTREAGLNFDAWASRDSHDFGRAHKPLVQGIEYASVVPGDGQM